MTRGFRGVAALALLAGLLVPAPGRAAPARAATSWGLATAVHASGGRLDVERAPLLPDQAIRAARETLVPNADGVAVLVTAARIRLEAIYGRTIRDPFRILDRTRNAHAGGAPSSEETSSSHDADPAGDLDGDGLGDVLVTDFSERFVNDGSGVTVELLEFRVSGVRGLDGSVLWTHDLIGEGYSLVVPLLEDVDGDGRDDLLRESFVLDQQTPGTCVQRVCAGLASASYHWNVGVSGGESLTGQWNRQFFGSATFRGAVIANAVYAGAMIQNGTAAFVNAELAGDADSDGKPDLVLNSFDIDESGAFVETPVQASYIQKRSALTALVVRGTDGSALLTRTRPGGTGAAVMLPVGNATGNADADVAILDVTASDSPVFCASATGVCGAPLRTVSGSLEMIDASGGATAWIVPLGSDLDAVAGAFVLGDLNGDGYREVSVHEIAGTEKLVTYSGDTGDQLWERPHDAMIGLYAAGEIGGAPGLDLVAVDAFTDGTAGVVIQTQRIDGANGSLLSVSTRILTAPATGSVDAFSRPIADADGDGVRDLLTDAQTTTPSGSSLVMFLDSGASGVLLATQTLAKRGTWSAAGDVNGDGLEDLAVTTIDDAQRSAATTVRPAGGAVLWTREVIFGDVETLDVSTETLGDTDGVPGAETAYARTGSTSGEITGRFDVIARDGSFLWGDGDAFSNVDPPPPPPPPGAIAGRVTGEGSPLAGICVGAYRVDGTREASAATAADGTYTLVPVPVDDYKIHFDDCSEPTWSPEWFDDAADSASADPVTVTTNATTSGVDADLAPVPAPPNDDAASPATIDALPYDDDVALGNATAGAEEECGNERTAWYRYAPLPGGTVFVSVGGDFAPVVGVFSGPDSEHLTLVQCSSGSTTSAATTSFLARPDQVYWIQAGAWLGTGGLAHVHVSTLPE